MGANKKTLKLYHDALDVLKSISEINDALIERRVCRFDPNWVEHLIKFEYRKEVDRELYPEDRFWRSAEYSVCVDYNIESGHINMYIEARTASHFPIKICIDEKCVGNYNMVDNILTGIKIFLKNEVNRMVNDRMVQLEDKKNAVAS